MSRALSQPCGNRPGYTPDAGLLTVGPVPSQETSVATKYIRLLKLLHFKYLKLAVDSDLSLNIQTACQEAVHI